MSTTPTDDVPSTPTSATPATTPQGGPGAEDSSPGTRSRRLRYVLTGSAVAVIAVAAAAVAAHGGGNTPVAHGADGGVKTRIAAAHQVPHVLSTADGSLLVGAVHVPQMPGACNGQSCYYVPQTTLATVTAPGASVNLHAGKSKQFTVSAFNLTAPKETVPLSVSDGHLVTAKLSAGTYQVTMYGVPAGGAWEFRLVVPAVNKPAVTAMPAHAAPHTAVPVSTPHSAAPVKKAATTAHRAHPAS